MLSLDQYPDCDAIEAAARVEGLIKTTEDYQRLRRIIDREMYTRDLVERIIGYLKTHHAAGRADLYRRFRGDNHKTAFNDTMLRLLSSGHVRLEKVKPEGARGRKVETLVWSEEVLPNTPKYDQLLERLLDQDAVEETTSKSPSAQEIAPPVSTLEAIIETSKAFPELAPVLDSSEQQPLSYETVEAVKNILCAPLPAQAIEFLNWSDKVIEEETGRVSQDASAQKIASATDPVFLRDVVNKAQKDLIDSVVEEAAKDLNFRNSEQTCYPANPEGRACKNIGETNDGSAGNAKGEPTLSGVGSTLSQNKTEAELVVPPPKPAHKIPSQTTTDKRFDW